MKKRMLALLLAVIFALGCSVPALAATKEQINIADAMNELGLFQGTDKGYELDSPLIRDQGITLLIRLLGEEEAALNSNYKMPFDDVTWAKKYVSYAYAQKITDGISDTKYGSANAMPDFQFITMVLRALGYSDKGETPLFVYNDPYKLAAEIGLLSSEKADDNFTRGDAVALFWNALSVKLYNSSTTLAQRLIRQGVFTQTELNAAKNTQKNGRTENVGVPLPEGDSGSDVGGNTGSGVKPDAGDADGVTYGDYLAMSDDEKWAFAESFDNLADYFAWEAKAKAEYEKNQNSVEVGDGPIDIGDILGG